MFIVSVITFTSGMRLDMLDDHNYFSIPVGNEMILEEVGVEELQLDGFNINLLQDVSMDHSEIALQDRYLSRFNLHRIHIIGDGNCLFRAMSYALYGHQDFHSQLRHLAVETLRLNLQEFSDYFLNDRGSPLEQIEMLSQPNTYAGQECIYAIAKALDINILVTFGGDESSPEVVTMENTFSHQPRQNRIHLIWSRLGGGHYEAVTDFEVEISNPVSQNQNFYNIKEDFIYTKPWTASSQYSKQVDMVSIGQQQPIAQDTNEIHTYAKKETAEEVMKPSHDAGLQKRKLVCSDCKLSFSNSFSLKRHKKVHSHSIDHGEKSSNLYSCMSTTCKQKFKTADHVVQHAIQSHGANIAIDNLEFNTNDEFQKFREQEEMKSNTRFVLRNRVKTNQKKEKCYTLECHRNGCTRSHSKKQQQSKFRRENIKGHCQLNSFCPARFSVCEKKDGRIEVKYTKSHTHSLSIEQSKFMPLPDTVKTEILNMLSMKVPITNILDKVRSHFSDRNQRENLKDKYFELINRQTIHNLKRKLADPSVMQHSNDAISTFIKVGMLQKEKFNPVLIFKQQDTDPEPSITPGLQKQDFVLAIMTKEQLDIYKKFANRIVCMDSTHKTNSYSFKLITLLVPDQFRKGYPVAFCISNREDETVMALFLSAIKSRSPDTKVNVIMTDDDNSGWNAACSVFGNDIEHYLCAWHVNKAWIRKIHHLLDTDAHKSLIYSFLCAMLEAKSESQFQEFKSVFVSELQSISPSFLQYMEDHYFHRSEKWAKSFRKGDYCKVDTNMFLESFHNQLKSIYFEGKRNKRIDVLLETLLRLENDLFIRHFKRVNYNIPCQEDTKIQSRHKSSLEINISNIHQLSQTLFLIKSKEKEYRVEVIKTNCDQQHCYYKCKEIPCIDLCYHLYKCSCPDYNSGQLCKHIHKVHSLVSRNLNDEDSVDDGVEFVEAFNSSKEVQKPVSNDPENLCERIKDLLQDIGNQLEHPNIRRLRLRIIHQCLQSIFSGNEACINMQTEVGCLKETEKFTGNAKNILQPRFHSTDKKKGRSKKTPIHKPCEKELRQLLKKDKGVPKESQPSPPSVRPYPLTPVPRNVRSEQTDTANDQPFNNRLQMQSNFRIPPSMFGKKVTIMKDGKKHVLIFGSGVTGDTNNQNKSDIGEMSS